MEPWSFFSTDATLFQAESEAHKGCNVVRLGKTPDQDDCIKLAMFLGTTTTIPGPLETMAHREGALEGVRRAAALG